MVRAWRVSPIPLASLLQPVVGYQSGRTRLSRLEGFNNMPWGQQPRQCPSGLKQLSSLLETRRPSALGRGTHLLANRNTI